MKIEKPQEYDNQPITIVNLGNDSYINDYSDGALT